jgi:hypothetical protein
MVADDDRSATPSTRNSAAVMFIDVLSGLPFSRTLHSVTVEVWCVLCSALRGTATAVSLATPARRRAPATKEADQQSSRHLCMCISRSIGIMFWLR